MRDARPHGLLWGLEARQNDWAVETEGVSKRRDCRDALGPGVPAWGVLSGLGSAAGAAVASGAARLGPGDPPELGPEAGVVLGLSSPTESAFWRPMVSSSWSA